MFRAGIYIGWVGFLNLGDEAMFELCRQRFPSIRWSRLENISYAPNPVELVGRDKNAQHFLEVLADEVSTQRRLRSIATKTLHKIALISGREVGLCGGGTYINRNTAALGNYLSVRNRIGSPVPTFGTGVINPEFWSTREEGWVDRRKEWVSAFAELPLVGVRGPISKALLEDAGATNVTVCGDPAVAFHRRYVGKTRSRTHGNSLQVGINTGDCSGQLWGCQEDVQVALTAAACWLRESGHQIEIIPVWQKDVEACIELARNAGLDRATVTPVCYTHEAFLERVERLDLLICLKLHAGILAAAANVPFVSLEYQPKCHDFASSINWDEFSIRTDQLKPGKLIELVNGLMAQLEAKSEELCATLCKLMNNFEKYCAHIEPLLLRSN